MWVRRGKSWSAPLRITARRYHVCPGTYVALRGDSSDQDQRVIFNDRLVAVRSISQSVVMPGLTPSFIAAFSITTIRPKPCASCGRQWLRHRSPGVGFPPPQTLLSEEELQHEKRGFSGRLADDHCNPEKPRESCAEGSVR